MNELGAPVGLGRSEAWEDGDQPRLAVVVATFNRAGFLPDLVAALEAQTLDPTAFEVVIADNGSVDDTPEVLARLTAGTSMRLRAIRIDVNRGPAPARNAAAAHSRAPLLVFTDDDCLPTPGWLAAVERSFAAGADVVQGSTRPGPEGASHPGPWARTIS